jgi:hypothetical protein
MSKLCFDDRVDVLVWMEYLRTEVATYVAAFILLRPWMLCALPLLKENVLNLI